MEEEEGVAVADGGMGGGGVKGWGVKGYREKTAGFSPPYSCICSPRVTHHESTTRIRRAITRLHRGYFIWKRVPRRHVSHRCE